ncbi:UrcA family protein [Parasphingopyxis lamellibrachiae]|uniref:UrcA family protein n=1 Tax=Parasphingopyxis lamellibrachiae TaxID=680125 RepID=A0A3D9FGE1_9SPHN|nr:UrcA family protein [Parasphingopyxis lamellibrachiae]RED16843.1 UrcA family protein [Parasphingopyxis lamellibrachiae]
MKKVAFAVAAVAMAGTMTHVTTSPALAGMATAETVTIDTAAYNLRTVAGYGLMTDRIDRAAKQVCGTVDVRDIAGAYEVRSCQAGATADALAQLNGVARPPSVTVGASR